MQITASLFFLSRLASFSFLFLPPPFFFFSFLNFWSVSFHGKERKGKPARGTSHPIYLKAISLHMGIYMKKQDFPYWLWDPAPHRRRCMKGIKCWRFLSFYKTLYFKLPCIFRKISRVKINLKNSYVEGSTRTKILYRLSFNLIQCRQRRHIQITFKQAGKYRHSKIHPSHFQLQMGLTHSLQEGRACVPWLANHCTPWPWSKLLVESRGQQIFF